ncbi:cytochrome b/b6 domain-containing protein [Sphingomonas nostoxanthinifaciens]|uniref:cytochrome b/b6 domain-containing protein n=1 Tax=Sphingomonas nostoxanthinifaciens TaxID=2872652 RepID=UPI001CC20A96|nr:cytochrome b/b6 domain-containing protein [Sphingomonas nostoxanthinifaciens]
MADPVPTPWRYRHRLPTRLWHWLNALTVIILLMSGLMIFNAHPRLYWGQYGANLDRAWLQIGPTSTGGHVVIGSIDVPTTGVLGRWRDKQGNVQTRAFPYWATIPSRYSLAGARRWHILFAWLLVVPGFLYVVASLINRHFRRDLLPSRDELRPRHLWQDVKDHARLRLPTGDAAARYNILQKLAYDAVIFGLIPLMILTGLTMAPAFDATFPWLLELFGGRQSARSLHFLSAMGLLAFTIVHLTMVVLAGPVREIRSMLTGWFRLPPERRRND